MSLNKLSNPYVKALPRGTYETTPKAVWAAIAFSFARQIAGDETASDDAACIRIRDEWRCLYENEIVPQKPPKETA